MTSREKAEKLLRQMTLEEKVGQLVLCGGCNVDDKGVPDSPDLIERIREGRCGLVLVPPQDIIGANDYMQKVAVEESRLHIPLLINSDMLHGLETIFPIPLAAACSFDTALVEKCAEASAEEACACGIRYTNAPMVDISRDARWGRIAESQGEDPYLAGEMAKSYVRGFQNDKNYVMATLKHYAGYGGAEGGRDYGTVEMNENTMLNTYLVPFREGVSAGADSVMTGFNALDNMPMSGNRRYLREILREKFGFRGIVISDAMSINEMIPYGVCADISDCDKRAMEAGVDIDLGGLAYPELVNCVKKGKVSQNLIDQAVLRVLEKKYDLGLFENPYSKKDKSCVFSKAHLDLSEKLARESAVLLKNDGVLPLNKSLKIAIIGKFADSKDFLGCWHSSGKTQEVTTLSQAFIKAGYTVSGVWPTCNIAETEKAIEGADAVIFTCGEYSYENGEACSKHDLRLKKEETDCFAFIKKSGKKTVSLVFAGRPLILDGIDSDALAYCWDLGHKTAEAVVSLLSGECNFSGKLSATIPAHEGQLPIYYARKRVGRPYRPDNQAFKFQCRYDDGGNEPAYPFGYGLSFSKFRYKNLAVVNNPRYIGEDIILSVEVENDSDFDGVEIAQLYISDSVSEIVRPIRELKDFKRVEIKAHDTSTITFTVTQEKLKYYHADGTFCADAGEFIFFVGGDSSATDSVTVTLSEKL